MKVLIVGGVAGGASAATRLRRLNETVEIVMFEKGPYISYANCGLPYFIGGTIKEEEKLIVTKPDLLENRFGIDVRINSEVVSIQPAKKTVTVKNHQTGKTYEESYDRLILSPGAEPKRPPLPGIDSEGIFSLRTVPDTLIIDRYISEKKPNRAVVVGAGFIGIEMAENLKDRGLDVTIVEFAPQAIAPLDLEMAAIVHEHLRQKGVNLLFGTGVASFEKTERALKVHTNTNLTIDTDLVILSIGVSPESKLAKDAGLELGIANSIKVNEYYQTSDENIYAVGDAIEVPHFVTGKETLIPLAGPANKQGRAVAENVLGLSIRKDKGVQGSSVIKVFDLTVAATGLNEKQCQAEGISYEKVFIHPSSHATYYPGSTQMSLKLLFTPEGKILGAQGVGYEGVEKRIDVLATAIRFHGTVFDLEELELCYAPPYSSAKDPVNMLGFVAANIVRGQAKVFHYDEVEKLDLSAVTLIDVRTEEENYFGGLPGAKNIALDDLRTHLSEIPKDKPVYISCQVGLRGYLAQRILMENGYDVYNLSGGYQTYIAVMKDKKAREEIDQKFLLNEKSRGLPSSITEHKEEKEKSSIKVLEVDACGLQCPGPILKVAEAIKEIEDGDIVKVRSTDPAFASDVNAWCERTCNDLIDIQSEKGIFEITIKKGSEVCLVSNTQVGNNKTMVVFSGDLDKALAAFIIANGAAAMGRKVTLFFTFWGLNILRKNESVNVKKNFIEKMFGLMMPRGSKKLGLSRMHMAGIGPRMIRGVMKSKNVQSLEELIKGAMDNGVTIIACQMSMDVMGIKHEELIDGVKIGGVATYLGAAETADTNLFI